MNRYDYSMVQACEKSNKATRHERETKKNSWTEFCITVFLNNQKKNSKHNGHLGTRETQVYTT